MASRLLTVKDVAAAYGVSERMVREWATEKGCPVLKRTKNQKYLFIEDLLDSWLRRRAK